ncbi:hypothetical protein ACJX0J_014606, partial [Zea mays]
MNHSLNALGIRYLILRMFIVSSSSPFLGIYRIFPIIGNWWDFWFYELSIDDYLIEGVSIACTLVSLITLSIFFVDLLNFLRRWYILMGLWASIRNHKNRSSLMLLMDKNVLDLHFYTSTLELKIKLVVVTHVLMGAVMFQIFTMSNRKKKNCKKENFTSLSQVAVWGNLCRFFIRRA